MTFELISREVLLLNQMILMNDDGSYDKAIALKIDYIESHGVKLKFIDC